MKKSLLLSILLITGITMVSQPYDHEERREKFDAMQAAFITEKLDLSPQEAQIFWPIFNERNEKVHKLRLEYMGKMRDMKKSKKSIDDMSDSDLEIMMLNRLDNESKIADINKSYHNKFLEVLGVKKTAKLYMSELEFKQEIMRRHKGPDGGRGPNHHQGPPE